MNFPSGVVWNTPATTFSYSSRYRLSEALSASIVCVRSVA